MPVLWKLQDAENHLGEVVDRAIAEGPQTITRHGNEVAVLISADEFKKLARPQTSLVQFLRESPLAEAMKEEELDFSRSSDTGRTVEL